MINKKVYFGILFLIILVCFSSCAPAGRTYEEYGFFSGILHGFCFPFALLGKIIGADVGLYADHNSGFFYWIGFLLGMGGFGGGGARASR